MNLTILDELIMDLECGYVRSKFDETNTPCQSMLLSAQSQMWIFSAYEFLLAGVKGKFSLDRALKLANCIA